MQERQRFSRQNEQEADRIGILNLEKAGYDPRAGVTLWQKMAEASKGAPPQFLSTHPTGPTRIRDIEANIPKVQGLYDRAERPAQRFGPPKPAAAAAKALPTWCSPRAPSRIGMLPHGECRVNEARKPASSVTPLAVRSAVPPRAL